MTAQEKSRPAPPAPLALELEETMRALSSIGTNLVESYRSLERRARRVEDELVGKVAELDAVTRHLEAILAALPMGVVVRDGGGTVVRRNPAAARILAEASAAGEPPRGEQVAGEWRQREIERAGGGRLVLASRRSSIAPGGDAGAGSVEILDDRTQLAELQERLHALDKLAALGNVAGGIAHEIKNPMNAIKGFAALLERRLEADTQENRWAALILAGACECEEILASMLTLAAPDRLVLETVDPRELAESAAAMALEEHAREPAARRAWQIEIAAGAPAFAGDRIKLRQALRNLVSNALQAQPRGGSVAVAIERSGAETLVRVADAGPGIPAEIRARVLEPFFTTRAEGTGLGLALVATIVRLHGGRLEVSDRPSRLGGAEIRFAIPIPHPA